MITDIDMEQLLNLENCIKGHLACNEHGQGHPCLACRLQMADDMEKYQAVIAQYKEEPHE